MLNYFLERLGDVCSRTLRRLSLLASQSLPPLLSSILSRVQFFAQWGVAKNRSDFVHSLPRMWAPQEACRGTSWLVPVERVPEVFDWDWGFDWTDHGRGTLVGRLKGCSPV